MGPPRCRKIGSMEPEDMIDTKDIMEAALLPFRMTSKATPTRVVIRNAVLPKGS